MIAFLYHALYDFFSFVIHHKIWWQKKRTEPNAELKHIHGMERKEIFYILRNQYVYRLPVIAMRTLLLNLPFSLSPSLSVHAHWITGILCPIIIVAFQPNEVCVCAHTRTHKHTDTFIIGKINICLGSREFFKRSVWKEMPTGKKWRRFCSSLFAPLLLKVTFYPNIWWVHKKIGPIKRCENAPPWPKNVRGFIHTICNIFHSMFLSLSHFLSLIHDLRSEFLQFPFCLFHSMLRKQTEQNGTTNFVFLFSILVYVRWNEVRLESIWHFNSLIKYSQFVQATKGTVSVPNLYRSRGETLLTCTLWRFFHQLNKCTQSFIHTKYVIQCDTAINRQNFNVHVSRTSINLWIFSIKNSVQLVKQNWNEWNPLRYGSRSNISITLNYVYQMTVCRCTNHAYFSLGQVSRMAITNSLPPFLCNYTYIRTLFGIGTENNENFSMALSV